VSLLKLQDAFLTPKVIFVAVRILEDFTIIGERQDSNLRTL